ncbi:type I restriction-modification system specificity subunit [soil metagenome]
MSELPKGWERCLLDEINDPDRPICYGILMPGPDLPIGVPYVKVRNIRGERILLDDVHRTSVEIERKYARSRLRAGDLLVSIRGTFGRTAAVPSELDGGNITQDTARIAPVGVHPPFVLRYLQSPQAQGFFKSVARGVAVKGVNIGDLRKLPVAVPPLAEQERIVDAIDEAFSKLDAGEAGLRTVRQLLKRMRRAVLAAAATGLLVPQDATDTAAAKVLADLGVKPFNDPSLPVLPAAWTWARVQDIGQVDLGRQRSPKYHSGDNMKPYLRVANVFEDRIDTSDVMEMHFEPEAFERSRLALGDILLNEGQTPELLGRPAMYRGEPPEVAFTNSLLRFRAGPGIEPDWALLVFRHHMHSGRFTRESRITTNIAHLSAARFKPVEFPVPPIEEQRRVVEEFDRLSSFMAACERAVDAELARSASLRRSVLKAAFEGRLVPQDSADEPSSNLLARIHADRARSDGSTRGRRRNEVEAS